jgi:hypothetical protein
MGAWQGPNPLSSFDNWLTPVLGALRGSVNAILQWIKGLWEFLWNHILKRILTAGFNLLARIRKVLEPIIRTLRRIRDAQMRLFDFYVRPILNFIQRLRAALLIFRIFHLKWANALDNRLAGMESRLTALWLNVLRDFNRVLSYFDLIMDPTGYFRAGVYISTAIRSISALWATLHALPSVPLSAAASAGQAHDSHLCDFKTVRDNATLAAAAGLQPDYAAVLDAIWTELQAMGYQRYT